MLAEGQKKAAEEKLREAEQERVRAPFGVRKWSRRGGLNVFWGSKPGLVSSPCQFEQGFMVIGCNYSSWVYKPT